MEEVINKLAEYYKSLKTLDEISVFWEIICDGSYWDFEDGVSTCKSPSIEFCVSIYKKYIDAQAKMRDYIETMCKESLAQAIEKGVIDYKNFAQQQKNLSWPMFFQPPIVTSGLSHERNFINAVFSRWKPVEWQKYYFKMIDKTFKAWL